MQTHYSTGADQGPGGGGAKPVFVLRGAEGKRRMRRAARRQAVRPALGRRAPARRPAAATAVLTLLAGLLLPVAAPAQAASEDVIAAGRVFADYDGDGVYDTDPDDGFVEHGVHGVAVTVTDALGRSATTRSLRQQQFVGGIDGTPGHWEWTSDGDWSMTEGEFEEQAGEPPFVKAGQDTAQLRVTFSDVPAGYESWFAADEQQNDSSVQFVSAGDEGVDFALLHPEEHRQDPLDVVTAVQSAGDPDPTGPDFIDTPALIATDWTTSQEIHSYIDANGNGQYDEGEDFAPTEPDGDEYRYFDDANGNGFWDAGEALSEVAFEDTLGNPGIWDSGPWTNPTVYSTLTPADTDTITAAPVSAPNVRVLLPGPPDGPGGECWTGPLSFTERLVEPVTVPDDPSTAVDESLTPRRVAYYQSVSINCWNFTGTLQAVFVPGGFWDGEPQFAAFPTAQLTTPEDPRTIALFSELGSVWGVAYEQTSNSLIVSAVYKRVSGLAEHRWTGADPTAQALGGIYLIPELLEEGTAKVSTDIVPGEGVEPWFSLVDLEIDVGTVPSNEDRGLGAASAPVSDPDGFAQAATVGIGGIDTWTDGSTTYLFVMNLADRTLYRIDISGLAEDPGFVPDEDDVLDIPLDDVLGEGDRPWAVEVWHDRVYIGWTETGTAPGECAEITDPGDPPWSGPEEPDPELPECDDYQPLDGHVASVGIDGDGLEEVFEFSLGYPRGNPIGNWGDQGDRYADENPQTRHWNTWTDEWSWEADGPDAGSWPDGSVGIDASGGSWWSTGHYLQVYPQAVLSSLTFDPDGFLSLGLMDRTELQAGNIQWAADAEEEDGNLYFEAVSFGDMLVAGWDEFPLSGPPTYVLENSGYTRARFGEDGTYTQRWDESVEHHTTGPGGFEFYDDDQALDASARGAGTLNHEEVALGAVLRVPGGTEVASTAFDPLTNIRVQGLMWFTEDAGTPDRAVELTQDPGQASSPGSSFQKGGGLGDLDALIPPPPVEIGNRVWFDADQDGYQSADEPGIGGVTVLLLDGEEEIGSQTTQPDGTYYFSSRESDPDHYAPMEFGEDYTVRFVKPDSGTLTVSLWGTLVSAPWEQVPFTEQQVEPVVALANPHDPEDDNADGVNERPDPLPEEPEPVVDVDRIDSNPDVDSGEYAFTLGGAGRNEHSIDAGFLALAPLDVVKAIDPDGADASPGATFDLSLQVTDFRGLPVDLVDPDPDAAFTFEDLADLDENAGLVTAADPDGIADGVLTVVVGSDGSVPVTRVWLPIGSTVEVVEAATDDVVEVVYTPEGPVLLDDGDPAAAATIRITNTMAAGAFTVEKAMTGDATEDVPDSTAFAMEYSVDGGDTWIPFTVGYDADGSGTPAPWTSPELAAGTEVLVREAVPLPAPPAGVVWGDQVISGDGVDYDAGTGIASFTVSGDGTAVELLVTNTAEVAPGGFQVVKEITGTASGDVPGDTVFPLEYSIDGGSNWLPLEVTADGTPAIVDELPAGTIVQLREPDPLPVVDGVVWGVPMISVGAGEPQPGPVTFVIGAGTTVSITVANLAEPEPGTFSVRKIVIGGAAGVIGSSAPTFVVEYAVDDGEEPLDWIELEIPWGQVAFPEGSFPVDTVIQIREVEPLPVVEGIEWGDPQLFVDGEAVDSPATITIRPGDEPSPVISLLNTAEAAPGYFTVTKTLQGGAAGDVEDGTVFLVEYTIDGGEPEQLEVPFGETVTVPDLPAGSVVTITEVELPDIPGVDWETPVISLDGVPQTADPVSFTIEAGTGVAVGLVNTAEETPGRFSVVKAVVGEAADDVPAGTEFVLEYSIDGGESWAALVVPLGTLVTSGEIPAGTVVLVREGLLPDVPAVEFGEVEITGEGVTADPETGYPSFTAESDTTVELTMTNTAEAAPGGFRLVKEIAGAAAADVPVSAAFSFEYRIDGGGSWLPLELAADGVVVTVDGLPAGTVVQLRETPDRPEIPGVDWGDVVISGAGVDYDESSGIASFTIGAGARVVVTATNAADLLPGGFSIEKLLSGDAAEEVPEGARFVFEYSLDGGPPVRVTVVVGESWTSEQLPAGTAVAITEVELPEVDGVEWGDPVLTVDGALQAGLTASFVIGAADALAVVVTNEAGPPPPPAPEPPDGGVAQTGVDGALLRTLAVLGLLLVLVGGLLAGTHRGRRRAVGAPPA